MANSGLTPLIPTIYESLDIVSRELVGFAAASTLDASSERAAVGQSILTPITPASAPEDIVPGQLPPDTGDQAIGNTELQITKSRSVPFRWTGEEVKGLRTGPGYDNIRRDQITQAMRALVNEVEVDLGAEALVSASRAAGTAGTTPFELSVGASAQTLKILEDNGSPTSDLQMVIDTTAGAALRTNTQLTKANEAASDATLRRGVLLDMHGFAIRESAGVARHTAGSAGDATVDGAHAEGDTVIAITETTAAFVVGDVVTFDGFDDQYVVSAVGATDITLGAPGLRQPLAGGEAITVVADYAANVAFHRSALVLLARSPALPDEGDMASDRMVVTDPKSGISFEFAVYPQYRRVRYEVGLAWGVAGIKPEHTALLLG